MKRNYWLLAIVFLLSTLHAQAGEWIRINQLGYLSQSKKVAVFMSEVPVEVNNYSLVDVFTGKTVRTFTSPRKTGPIGQMKSTYRLDFSTFDTPGTYYLKAETVIAAIDCERSSTFVSRGTNFDFKVVTFRTINIELATVQRPIISECNEQTVIFRQIITGFGIQCLDVEDTVFINSNILKLVVLLPNGCIKSAIINNHRRNKCTIVCYVIVLERNLSSIANVDSQISRLRLQSE